MAQLMSEQTTLEAWIIDDTGFPKHGRYSLGVARQYCGALGKVGNCQIGVSLNAATDAASCPLDWRRFMPAEWERDGSSASGRMCPRVSGTGRTGRPPAVRYRTKRSSLRQLALNPADAEPACLGLVAETAVLRHDVASDDVRDRVGTAAHGRVRVGAPVGGRVCCGRRESESDSRENKGCA